METDTMKYMVTLEYRLGQINFNAHRLSFPQNQTGGTAVWSQISTFVLEKPSDTASNVLRALIIRGTPGIKKITIKIEKTIGRTTVVSRYATVFNALITNMSFVPGPGDRETSEAVHFGFDKGSMKFN